MVHIFPRSIEDTRFLNNDYAKKLLSEILEISPTHVIITLGQNEGLYFPNSSYLKKRCGSDYNVVKNSEIAFDYMLNELNKHGVNPIFYLTFRAPQSNKKIIDCLGDTTEQEPTTSIFIQHWSNVIEEWGGRYAQRFNGWWFDGAYNINGIADSDWRKLCKAIVGSGNSIVAFNAGEGGDRALKKIAPCQTITAGEFNTLPKVNNIKISNGLRLHVLTFSGDWWGKGGLRFSSDSVVRTISNYPKNTLVTFDVEVLEDGMINKDQKNFVKDLIVKVRK